MARGGRGGPARAAGDPEALPGAVPAGRGDRSVRCDADESDDSLDSTVDYINTGSWSKKALGEAKRYCHVNVAADAADSNYTTVPPQSGWRLTPGAAYLHYTPNETIGGVEFPFVPRVDVPLVADMSSTILSRPIEVSALA